MALELRVIGKRGQDTAVLVTVDTGQHISRLLLDCGNGIIPRIPYADSSGIQHLLFSHYHMDHVAGFDGYFRRHYDRADFINHIWGPPGTGVIMGHRFQGFVWNLIGDRQSTWLCHDIHASEVTTLRHELAEAFTQAHDEGSCERSPLIQGVGFQVQAITLDHGIPSIGYVIREEDRVNVDVPKLKELGLKPGPWLRLMQTEQSVEIDGSTRDAAELREQLLLRSKGQSMAFLTDFIAEDQAEQQRIANQLGHVDTLICECQYAAEDAELARKNSHMTSEWVGQLAAEAQPGRLLLTHFSDRYPPKIWDEMVGEVRRHFAKAEAAE
jgi:ribonuclease Z